MTKTLACRNDAEERNEIVRGSAQNLSAEQELSPSREAANNPDGAESCSNCAEAIARAVLDAAGGQQ